MNRGKYVICAMVGVGLTMAMFAWWARYDASQRILEAFGPDVAVAVRNGKTVELLQLSIRPSPSMDGRVLQTPDGQPLAYIVDRRDISDAPGLIHARHHLLHEQGFEWDEPPKTASPSDPHRSVLDRRAALCGPFDHGHVAIRLAATTRLHLGAGVRNRHRTYRTEPEEIY